jgi:signal transduction histidine kinase
VSPRAWAAPVPPGERRRLAALMACAVLDTDPEPEFDDLTAMVAEACDAPVALFNLIDRDRQWSKARVGFATPELPRDVAFCPHALASSDLLVIPDARLDPRFADNPLVVGEPYVRFYAGAPLELAGGERVGVLCVLDGRPRDLTGPQRTALRRFARQAVALLELRGALARAEAAQEDAARAGRDKGELLSRMSHELRTPLNAILGFSQLLQLEELTADQHATVDEVVDAGHLLLGLVDELLDLSRLEDGTIQLAREPVALAAAAAEAARLASPAAALRATSFALSGVPPALAVSADPQRLQQVLTELLVTAARLGSEGSSVRVAAGPGDAGEVRVTLTASGPPLPREQLAQAFEPFARVGDGEDRGLGLALCARIAEAMGGAVELAAAGPESTELALTLPGA